MSRMYNYVRARQLEGTYDSNPSTGTWPITSLRIMVGWGCPEESQWPYNGRAESWPPVEPPGMDKAAKIRRLCAYQRVRTLDDCKIALSKDKLVTAAFEIVSKDWQAPNGAIPPAIDPFDGSHTIALVGYDDVAQMLKFQNSWGVDWGENGFGCLSYAYFEQHLIEAWITEPALRSSNQGQGLKEITWAVEDPLSGSPLHGVEIFDTTNNECVAWCFITERDGYLDVEELFVRPQYRRTGHGRTLVRAIQRLAIKQQLPLRLLIPHADHNSSNDIAFLKLTRLLKLSVHASADKWLAFVAT